MHNKKYNIIILTSCLFGSFHLFSKSLKLINYTFSSNIKKPRLLLLINYSTLILSSYAIICCYYQCLNLTF